MNGPWDHRYRQLKCGEVIRPSDECRRDDGSWVAGICVGTRVPDPCYTSHRVYRRLKHRAALIGNFARVGRHLRPRIEAGRWSGAALTKRPGGGEELPPGIMRSMAIALGNPTTRPVQEDVEGAVICIQWLGLMVEIGAGRVR